MNWIYRIFVVFVLLETMAVCHCFQAEAHALPNLVSLHSSHAYFLVDYTHSLPDVYEILEIKEGSEPSEEKSHKSIPASPFLTSFSHKHHPERLLGSLREGDPDLNAPAAPLFLLYHSWRLPC